MKPIEVREVEYRGKQVKIQQVWISSATFDKLHAIAREQGFDYPLEDAIRFLLLKENKL